MEWQHLAAFNLSESWQYSLVTRSTHFKLIHTISNYSSQESIALIALINDAVTPMEIFEPRRIIPRREAEIINFTRVYNWDYKLAIRQIKFPN